jgi:IclR family transcriptional regulator, pca regulon regulatory protein
MQKTADTNHARSIDESDPEFVGSLERGLRILATFGNYNDGLTLAEVTRSSGLSAATARRFLRTLQELGYVSSTGRYFALRLKSLSIGHSFLASIDAPDKLQPILKDFAQRTGCNASVSVLYGTDILFIASAGMNRLVRLPAAAGIKHPAYASAMGRVLLAQLPQAQFRGYLRAENFRRLTEHTEVRPKRINELVREAKENGFCLVHEELEIGLFSLAVPLRGTSGQVCAAMDCSSINHGADLTPDLSSRLQVLKEFATRVEKAVTSSETFERAVNAELGLLSNGRGDLTTTDH